MDTTWVEIKQIAKKHQLNIAYGGRQTGKSWFTEAEKLTYFMTKYRKQQYNLIGTDQNGGTVVAIGQDVHDWLIKYHLHDNGTKAGWEYAVKMKNDIPFWGTVSRVTLTPELYSMMILQWAN